MGLIYLVRLGDKEEWISPNRGYTVGLGLQ